MRAPGVPLALMFLLILAAFFPSSGIMSSAGVGTPHPAMLEGLRSNREIASIVADDFEKTLRTSPYNSPAGKFGLLKESLTSNRKVNALAPENQIAPSCTPPPSGVVAWYPADGNPSDTLGRNGTLQSGATFTPGKVGQAFSFDGGNSYVQAPATGLPTDG